MKNIPKFKLEIVKDKEPTTTKEEETLPEGTKPKTSWYQRMQIRDIIRTYKKVLKVLQDKEKTVKQEAKTRTEIVESILALNGIFEITDEKGELHTEETLHKLSTKELIETLTQAVDELEKIV